MSTREHKCLLFAFNMGIWSYLQYTEYACQHHHNSPHPHQPPPLNTESLLLPSTHGYRMPGTRYLLILSSSRVVVLRPLQLSDRSRRRKSDKLAGHGKNFTNYYNYDDLSLSLSIPFLLLLLDTGQMLSSLPALLSSLQAP